MVKYFRVLDNQGRGPMSKITRCLQGRSSLSSSVAGTSGDFVVKSNLSPRTDFTDLIQVKFVNKNQQIITCWKSTIEKLEKGVKYVKYVQS